MYMQLKKNVKKSSSSRLKNELKSIFSSLTVDPVILPYFVPTQ